MLEKEKCFEVEGKSVCLTEKQIGITKDKFLEGYNEAQKKVERYVATGFKLPKGLDTKKPVPYKFKVSEEEANRKHKEISYRGALGLRMENDINDIKRRLKIYQKIFEDDEEVKPKLKEVKEFFEVENNPQKI